MYRLFFIIFFVLFLLLPLHSFYITYAQGPGFVSVVNPVRGDDFWENPNQRPAKTVEEQIKILKSSNIRATYLIRYDALNNVSITGILKPLSDEKGLFLEITPSWANQASVEYRLSESWHLAGSALLTGYDRQEREKLIDKAFERFKETFGEYPKSVGAWWIDGYSLEYMEKKFGISSALIVADQYTTDNYQIWGQFWSTPYYPSKRNVLEPARNMEDKLPVVVMQWAGRDPLNAYGNGVLESTYSVQANDYLDFHNLTTDYFSKLIDIYTNQKFNKFGQIVVGLENSYDWEKYKEEYKKQIQTLLDKRDKGQFSIVTMKDFADWYLKTFPDFSPEHIIETKDPLGSEKRVVWFMNLNYRAGWFYNADGSVFRDIHQYTGGEELCYLIRCDEVNFATSAKRVLDEVSFGHKWIIDEGKIRDFNLTKRGENFLLSYINEAGNKRTIELLDKDIGVDGKTSSIDGTILNQTEHNLGSGRTQIQIEQGFFKWSIQSAILKLVKFLIFLIVISTVPYLLIDKIYKQAHPLQKVFLSISLAFVLYTLAFYIFSLLGLKQLMFIYLFISTLICIRILISYRWINYLSIFKKITIKSKQDLIIIGLIGAGTIFQVIPTFRSGLLFPYGLGFWGPNTHDGVWHISLINQLMKNIPPQNPIFYGEILKNYHYFYDLLIAGTGFILNIPISDLIFRFYPVLFSLSLGLGTVYLIQTLFAKRLENLQIKLTTIFALYFVYFAGSFGWIVDYIKGKGLGGESNFWANQSISFNLNPPFAISLIIVIAIIQLLSKLNKFDKKTIFILALLCGSLVSFKAYAAVLILVSLLVVGILKRSSNYLIIFVSSLIISTILFLSNFNIGEKLILFSPFWFIHSMIDSPDRVGWLRLTLARETGFTQGNWFKFAVAEVLSLLLFIVGNLGVRVIGIFSLLKFKVIFQTNVYLFLSVFSGASAIIPLLFIQAGNPWNTIQFVYYFLYISAISSGLILARIFTRFGKFFAITIILGVGIITPINSWATANGYLYYKPHALITNKELEALKFLHSEVDGIVLVYPYDKRVKEKLAEPWPLFVYDSTSYVGAFSKKGVYLEDEPQNQILLTDYKKRLVASKDFFAKLGIGKTDFLKNNNIKYIYIPKIFKVKLSEGTSNLEVIFENEETIIYRVK